MSRFTDRHGREWVIEFDAATLDRVRAATGVDVRAAVLAHDTAALARLFAGPDSFGRVLWSIVERQAVRRGIDPVRFAAGFGGAVFGRAVDAILFAAADLQPDPVKRATVRRALRARAT